MNQFAIGIVCIVTLFILISMIVQNYVIHKNVKRYYLLSYSVAILIIATELGTTYFELSTIPFNGFYVLFNVIGFSISPIIGILISLTFSKNNKTPLNILLLPVAVNFVLAVLSPKFGYIFQISSAHSYTRGPLFAAYVAAYISSMLYFLIKTSALIKRNQGDGKYILTVLFLFLLSGTTVQILFPHIHISWLCVTVTLILLYTYFCELREKEDPLTNLFNRRAYEYYLSRLEKSNKAIIVLFDIDDFKNINDKYGHQYGDASLRIVANFIKETFSSFGKCYRIGGDEFCVFVRSSDEAIVKDAIKAFIKKITQYRETDSRLPMVSIGYSLYNKTVMTIDQAVKSADEQMYYYKENKKTIP